MKFGIGLAPFDRWASYEEMADAVVVAETMGFDYVTLPPSGLTVVPVT